MADGRPHEAKPREDRGGHGGGWVAMTVAAGAGTYNPVTSNLPVLGAGKHRLRGAVLWISPDYDCQSCGAYRIQRGPFGRLIGDNY